MRAAWQIHNLCRMEKQEPTPLKKLIRAFFWGNELKAFPLLKSAIFAFPHERHLKPTTATTTWKSKQKPKSAIFCFFSHSFSEKEYINIRFISITETCTHASRSYLSTLAVLQLDAILNGAKKTAALPPKNNSNQKGFEKMIVMYHECPGIGKVKMTVGVKHRTHEKVQYCITAIETE